MAKTRRRPDVALEAAVRRAPDFSSWEHVDKIRFFCWHLQSNCGFAAVRPADVARCYERLDLAPPSSIAPFFDLVMRRHPAEMTRVKEGCRLEARVLEELDIAYGADPTLTADGLESMVERVDDPRRLKYLEEALVCFRAGAYRASVAMVWNLAIDVLSGQVSGAALEASTERQMIQVCKRAGILTTIEATRLAGLLDRRDAAVRPSSTITALVADDLIRAAVEDVVLRFS